MWGGSTLPRGIHCRALPARPADSRVRPETASLPIPQANTSYLAMPLHPYRGVWPEVGARGFVAPDSHLTGDVTMGDDVSFWFATAARGDVHRIRIGDRTNVQDGTILHVSYRDHPLEIGNDVVIGHSAMVHGCVVEDGCLIGIGARVLDGCVLERGCQIGAGAVVAPGTRVPAGHLALGVPAKVKRPLSDDERQSILGIADRYRRLKDEYREALGDGLERVGREVASKVRPEEAEPANRSGLEDAS